MHLTVTSLLGTGADSNLIKSSFLPRSWHAHVNPVRAPLLKNGTRQLVTVQGLFSLQICIGDLGARTWVSIIESLAVDSLVWKSFIDRCIHGFFPNEWKVVSVHSSLMAILKSLPKVASLLLEKKVRGVANTARPEGDTMFPCCHTFSRKVPSHMPCSLWVISPDAGLSLIESCRLGEESTIHGRPVDDGNLPRTDF